MNFMFKWQEQYLTRSLRSILLLPREHKIHIFEQTCNVRFTIAGFHMTSLKFKLQNY